MTTLPNPEFEDAQGRPTRLHDIDRRRPLIVDVLRYYG